MIRLVRRDVLLMILAVGLVPALASDALAQQWAEKMFSERSHDFLTVGRGATAEHHFELKNLYEETVHIASVRTSCGCTTPSLTRQTLATGETGAVVAKFNTHSFIGQKSATITVVFDRPYYAEVQLNVTGFIRTDVTFEPSEVDFGQLTAGESGQRQLVVTHHGDEDWRITDVRSKCERLSVRLDSPEILRDQVRYRMTVNVDGAMPEGEIREHLTLVSNDSDYPTTNLAVTGRVRPALSVSPAAVSLGRAAPGRAVTQRLVVRADKPFAIREVVCEDERFKFELPEGRKRLHFLRLRFQAAAAAPPDAPQRLARTIRVVSDLPGDKSAEFTVTGTVTR